MNMEHPDRRCRLFAMGRRRSQAMFMACVLATAMLGCASTNNALKSWQQSVTRYIGEAGHGDPSVLRDLHDAEPINTSRSALTSIGTPGAVPNAQGLFVGVQTIGDQTWYIFVVGVSRDGGSGSALQDLRVVAMSPQGQDLQWRIGPADDHRLATYNQGLSRTWRRAFPAPTDDFHLEPQGDGVRVTEVRSGVTFTLALTSDSPTRLPIPRLHPSD